VTCSRKVFVSLCAYFLVERSGGHSDHHFDHHCTLFGLVLHRSLSFRMPVDLRKRT
jgi:hypothetical protein